MIKVYRYNSSSNCASHILHDKNGVSVRYNFEHGNVITKQKPELILASRYSQDLLEKSNLFTSGLVTLVRTERTEEDDALEKAEKEAKEKAEKEAKEKAEKELSGDDSKVISSVTTDAELIAFVNEAAGRTEKNEFHTTSNALKWATANGYSFPKYNPD